MSNRRVPPDAARYAEQFQAMGAEPRLRIVRLLLSAHPQGMPAGDIQLELDIPASTLSHHLDKLKNEDLVRVRREGTFLWYSANTQALRGIMDFLYAECCTRSRAIEPRELITISVAAGSPRPSADGRRKAASTSQIGREKK
ncbi:MAG: ArsR/SmtB family transcription factor [Deltaproteobacteria bacterium]